MRAIFFFLIAIAGIALIAWQGVGESDDGGPTPIETIMIVGAVLLGAHALRHLVARLAASRADRD